MKKYIVTCIEISRYEPTTHSKAKLKKTQSQIALTVAVYNGNKVYQSKGINDFLFDRLGKHYDIMSKTTVHSIDVFDGRDGILLASINLV